MAKRIFPVIFITLTCLWIGGKAWAQPSAFSQPRLVATLPWSDNGHPGAPVTGADWLVVDGLGRFWLEADLEFRLFSSQGRYLREIEPVDKHENFYGFTGMEALPGGRVLLLQRLETREEQKEKDNYELESRPGARLIVVDRDGKVALDRVEVDPRQPHSNYLAQNGSVYSIHADGSYELLDSAVPGPKDSALAPFAAVADVVAWNDHLRALPVFRFQSGYYHDVLGNLHEDKHAKAFLMGRPFVEGLAPLAVRNGRIYGQVIGDRPGGFTYGVFTEEPARGKYGFMGLIPAEGGLDAAYDHALFVDPKGNLYEGVARKDGYRIYEWRVRP